MKLYFVKKLFLIFLLFDSIFAMTLKPGDILPDGTYVVKNGVYYKTIKEPKDITCYIYEPEAKFIGGEWKAKPFDAVLVHIKEDKKELPLISVSGDGKVDLNFYYIHPAYDLFKPLPPGLFKWKSDDGRQLLEEVRLGSSSIVASGSNLPEKYKNGMSVEFESYKCDPEDVKYGGAMSFEKIDVSKYPEHPFNFKVKKLVDDKEVGPEYLVDFNKPKPQIISVIGAVEQPKAQDLQAKLGQLKNNLVALKGKLGALSGKLGELKGKLEKPYITLVNGSLINQSFPEKEFAAIVNAANGGLLGGGGIDGVIWGEVAKPGLTGITGTTQFKAQCLVLRRKKAQSNKKIEVKNPYRGDVDQEAGSGDGADYVAGEAGLTRAFGKLADKVGYVIHAIGPVGELPNELRSAYQNSLNRAFEVKLKVIAFCPISTGIFGYEINNATPVAIDAIVDWVRGHPDSGIEEIRLVTWDGSPTEYATYQKILREKSQSLEEITAKAKSIIDAQKLNESSSNKSGTTPPLVFCVKKS